MRDDQYSRLKALAEKLTDVVLVEADPEAWSGTGKQLQEMNREERGDRYWAKKNAAATMTLLMKVVSLTGHIERNSVGVLTDVAAEDDADIDKEVRQAEREGRKLLENLEKRAQQRGRTN